MREKIIAALSDKPEMTAPQIAGKIGSADALESVVNALNALRTDGIVECKKQSKGRFLIYWVTNAVSSDGTADALAQMTERAERLKIEAENGRSEIRRLRKELAAKAHDLQLTREELWGAKSELEKHKKPSNAAKEDGFAVFAAGRTPTRFLSTEKAQAAALTAARVVGKARLYKLVPVAVAIKTGQSVAFAPEAA